MKPGATIATIVRGVRGRRVLVADGSGVAEPARGPAASPVELLLIAAVPCANPPPPAGYAARRRARPIGTIPEALAEALPPFCGLHDLLSAGRVWVNTATAGSAFTLGALSGRHQELSCFFFGPLPPGRMIVGIALGVLYVGSAVGVVAFAAGLVRGTGATIGVALAFLLLMPVLALVPVIAPVAPQPSGGALDVARRRWRPRSSTCGPPR